MDSAKGDLSADGVLEVKVKGLVIDPNDPQAIAANLAGVNPSATFLAAVSCLAADGTTHNVFSDPFPATTGLGGGDARVEVQLTLPSRASADRVRDEPGARAHGSPPRAADPRRSVQATADGGPALGIGRPAPRGTGRLCCSERAGSSCRRA